MSTASIRMLQSATGPSTPPSGYSTLWAKTDDNFYVTKDTGVTVGLQGSSGTSGVNGATGESGPQGLPGAGGATGYYGAFFSSQDQSISVINTPQKVTLNNTELANQISQSGGTITLEKAGTYVLVVNALIENNSGSGEDVTFWLKYEGSDYPNSSHTFTAPARKSVGVPSQTLVSFEFLGQALNDNDTLEVYWQATSTDISLNATSGVGIPDSASFRVNISQVAYNGNDGTSGTSGVDGPAGPTGAQGPTGAGATQNLSQVLAIGNDTGDQAIQSSEFYIDNASKQTGGGSTGFYVAGASGGVPYMILGQTEINLGGDTVISDNLKLSILSGAGTNYLKVDNTGLVGIITPDPVGLVSGSGINSMQSSADLTTQAADACANFAIALGDNADAHGQQSIAIGRSAYATSLYSTAINNSQALADCAIAIGETNYANATASIAIGENSITCSAAANAIAIGKDGVSGGQDAVGIGRGTQAQSTSSIAIGSGPVAVSCAVSLGHSTFAGGSSSVGIGEFAFANGSGAIAIGQSTNTGAPGGIAIGPGARATATNRPISIGENACNDGNYAVAIGYQPTITGDNTIIIGNTSTEGASSNNNIAIGTCITVGSSKSQNIAFSTRSLGLNVNNNNSILMNASSNNGLGNGSNIVNLAANSNQFSNGNNSVLIGGGNYNQGGNYHIAIGDNNGNQGGEQSVLIGRQNSTGCNNANCVAHIGHSNCYSAPTSFSLGFSNTIGATGSVAIGVSNITSHDDAVVLGNTVSSVAASHTHVDGLYIKTAPTHADNAAALLAGLTAGQVYKTATGDLKIVY